MLYFLFFWTYHIVYPVVFFAILIIITIFILIVLLVDYFKEQKKSSHNLSSAEMNVASSKSLEDEDEDDVQTEIEDNNDSDNIFLIDTAKEEDDSKIKIQNNNEKNNPSLNYFSKCNDSINEIKKMLNTIVANHSLKCNNLTKEIQKTASNISSIFSSKPNNEDDKKNENNLEKGLEVWTFLINKNDAYLHNIILYEIKGIYDENNNWFSLTFLFENSVHESKSYDLLPLSIKKYLTELGNLNGDYQTLLIEALQHVENNAVLVWKLLTNSETQYLTKIRKYNLQAIYFASDFYSLKFLFNQTFNTETIFFNLPNITKKNLHLLGNNSNFLKYLQKFIQDAETRATDVWNWLIDKNNNYLIKIRIYQIVAINYDTLNLFYLHFLIDDLTFDATTSFVHLNDYVQSQLYHLDKIVNYREHITKHIDVSEQNALDTWNFLTNNTNNYLNKIRSHKITSIPTDAENKNSFSLIFLHNQIFDETTSFSELSFSVRGHLCNLRKINNYENSIQKVLQ